MAKMPGAELIKRDSKRNIGEEVLQAIRDIKAGRTGRVFHVEVTQATEARLKLGLSQTELGIKGTEEVKHVVFNLFRPRKAEEITRTLFNSLRPGFRGVAMTDVHITREEHGRHGRYIATVAGIEAEAELVFTHRGPGLISADHTLSPESLKGTGAASALVDRLIADARGQGLRIIPFCPYVRARYLKNPAWQDVMTVAPGVVPEPCADEA